MSELQEPKFDVSETLASQHNFSSRGRRVVKGLRSIFGDGSSRLGHEGWRPVIRWTNGIGTVSAVRELFSPVTRVQIAKGNPVLGIAAKAYLDEIGVSHTARKGSPYGNLILTGIGPDQLGPEYKAPRDSEGGIRYTASKYSGETITIATVTSWDLPAVLSLTAHRGEGGQEIVKQLTGTPDADAAIEAVARAYQEGTPVAIGQAALRKLSALQQPAL